VASSAAAEADAVQPPAQSPPKSAGVGSSATTSKRAVDHERAAAMAKRAADIASKAPGGGAVGGGVVATFSAFERQFNAVWAKGKGTPEALRTVLAHLPSSESAMQAFVRESLTDDLLSAIVRATDIAGEPVGVAAARVAHLAACKRFEMAWMFAGAAEKTSVSDMLNAAKDCAEVPAAELQAAAKRYGVKLS